MRRSIVSGIFVSTLITICALTSAAPAQAAEVNLRPKSDYEDAIARIENFADFQKYYGLEATAPVTPDMPFFREYEYLNSLLLKISELIDNYDDPEFTLRNAKSYNDAIPVVDRTISSLRYTFGIVQAENLAAKPANTPSTNAASSATSQTTQVSNAQTSAPAPAVAARSSVATTTTTETAQSSKSSDASSATDITTFESTDSKSANRDNVIEPIEIPNTGAGVSQTSSILFVVLVSFVAAVAATGIYFFYNHQTKRPTPASRKKRH